MKQKLRKKQTNKKEDGADTDFGDALISPEIESCSFL